MTLKHFFQLAPLLISGLAHAGIIEPNVLWDKKELTTCFYSDESQLALTILGTKKDTKKNYDFSPKKLRKSQRRNIINVITHEYTPERTGIHFVGFKDCADESNPDVIVMRAASKIFILDTPGFRGMAEIGQSGTFAAMTEINEKTGKSEFVIQKDGSYFEGFFSKSGKKIYIALRSDHPGTITHEFGHVAGLRHEHIREEAKEDNNCGDYRVVWPTKEKIYDTAQFETNYDNQLIMNYCYLQSRSSKVFEQRIGNILSQGDVQTLRAYY